MSRGEGAPPWLLVAGDFVRTGGMDAANHALASYLARSRRETHLVAHRVDSELAGMGGIEVHRVTRPLGSHLLGFPLLARAGTRAARRLAARDVVSVANGGNFPGRDACWLHYVHAAYRPRVAGNPLRRLMAGAARRMALRDERRVASRARIVLCNSELTARHAVELLGAEPERVHTVYYGADPDRFRPPSADERDRARTALGIDGDRPVLAFVGALGDRRKGFDTLFAALGRLAADPAWDAVLLVIGSGAELERWKARAAGQGMGERLRFLGFRSDVREILAACDALVSP
ncbi:MAG TPA: glycosyltransferase, partial [Longimicrobium sp.]|nr:glycosyltransferase [Longimicrobium sp.]